MGSSKVSNSKGAECCVIAPKEGGWGGVAPTTANPRVSAPTDAQGEGAVPRQCNQNPHARWDTAPATRFSPPPGCRHCQGAPGPSFFISFRKNWGRFFRWPGWDWIGDVIGAVSLFGMLWILLVLGWAVGG